MYLATERFCPRHPSGKILWTVHLEGQGQFSSGVPMHLATERFCLRHPSGKILWTVHLEGKEQAQLECSPCLAAERFCPGHPSGKNGRTAHSIKGFQIDTDLVRHIYLKEPNANYYFKKIL